MVRKKENSGLARIAKTAFVAVLLLGYLTSAIIEKSKARIQKVEFEMLLNEGEHAMMTETELREEVNSFMGRRLEGMQIKEFPIRELEDFLQDNPYLSEVECFVNSEEELRIRLKQRVPVVRVMSNSERSYYLDRQAERIPVSEHYTARVVVASGKIPAEGTVPQDMEAERNIREELVTLGEELREDPFLNVLIEQIHVDEQYDMILIPKIGEEIIILGDLSDLEIKLEKLRVFYREALTYEGWGKYKSLNLKFKDQVVGRMKT